VVDGAGVVVGAEVVVGGAVGDGLVVTVGPAATKLGTAKPAIARMP